MSERISSEEHSILRNVSEGDAMKYILAATEFFRAFHCEPYPDDVELVISNFTKKAGVENKEAN